MASSGIRVHAAFEVKDAAKAKEASQFIIEATRKEKGCLMYELFQMQGEGNDNKFAMIEHWETMEDLQV